jgi:hypothetical protein
VHTIFCKFAPQVSPRSILHPPSCIGLSASPSQPATSASLSKPMASHPLDPSFFAATASADMQMDFYEEEDVDQLDSDSDVDDDQDASSAKKGSSKKEGKRIPGHTLLPASRLDSIIQADGAWKEERVTE